MIIWNGPRQNARLWALQATPLLPRRWVRLLGALSSQLRRPGGPAVVSPRGEAFGRKGSTL